MDVSNLRFRFHLRGNFVTFISVLKGNDYFIPDFSENLGKHISQVFNIHYVDRNWHMPKAGQVTTFILYKAK